MKILKDPKVQLLTLLALLAAAGLAGARQWQANLLVLAVSLAAALLAEYGFFGAVKRQGVLSAAISGSIIGLLVIPGSLLFAWSAAVLAVASKKLLLFEEGRHIFNPAAFGLAAAVLIFGNRINWWGDSSAVLTILGAGFILFRMRRLPLPLSYFAARALAAAIFGGAGFSVPALTLPNLFFAFIMVVEPKTSPVGSSRQLLFGAGCGVLATFFYRYLPTHDGDILALLALNLARPLLPPLPKKAK